MTTKDLILELKIYKSQNAKKNDYTTSNWADYYIEEKSDNTFSLKFLTRSGLDFKWEGKQVDDIVIDFPTKEEAKEVANYFAPNQWNSIDSEPFRWTALTFNDIGANMSVRTLTLGKNANLKRNNVELKASSLKFKIDEINWTKDNLDRIDLSVENCRLAPLGIVGPRVDYIRINEGYGYGGNKLKDIFFNSDGSRNADITSGKQFTVNLVNPEKSINLLWDNGVLFLDLDCKSLSGLSPQRVSSNSSVPAVDREAEWKSLVVVGYERWNRSQLDRMTELVKEFLREGRDLVGGYSVPNAKNWVNWARPRFGLSELENSYFESNNNQNQGNDTPTFEEQEENTQLDSAEKYNELYKGGKHSILVKLEQLHSQIHDNFSQYKDKLLFKQMNEKEATFREFRSIWDKDDKNKKLEIRNFNDAELAKRQEVIKLMEQLIAENKGNSSDNSKKGNSDEQSKEPNQKPKTVSEIKAEVRNEVENHDKKVQNTLADLIAEAQGKNTYAELEPLLKEIDEHKGEKAYRDKENEITELKKKLIKIDSKSYKTSVSFELNDKLEKYGIATSDLDSETQTLIRKLEDETISEEEIIQVEKKASEAIGIKDALNKLDKLIKELETARKQKNTKKGEDKLQELISFVESSSHFQNQAYAQRREIVNNLIKGSGSSLNKESNDFSWVPIMAVGTIILVGIIGVIVYHSWKKKVKK